MSKRSVDKKQEEFTRKNPLAEHSMEFVANVNGVDFINDSIAIKVESTWNSLNACSGNVILLIGGIDSRNDYSMLEELVRKKVKAVITLGTDNSKIIQTFLKTGKEISAAISLQDAVEKAAAIAKAGDTVLFSPSCPSYHPFDNYKNRGNDFKMEVRIFSEKNSR